MCLLGARKFNVTLGMTFGLFVCFVQTYILLCFRMRFSYFFQAVFVFDCNKQRNELIHLYLFPFKLFNSFGVYWTTSRDFDEMRGVRRICCKAHVAFLN